MREVGADRPEDRVVALLIHAADLLTAGMDQARLWASDEDLDAAFETVGKRPASAGLVESVRAIPADELRTTWHAVRVILGPLTSDTTVAPRVYGRQVAGPVMLSELEPLTMFYISTNCDVYQSPVTLTFPTGVPRWLRGRIRIQAPANYPREDIDREELTFMVVPDRPGSSKRVPAQELLRGALDLAMDYLVVGSGARAILTRSGAVIASFDFVVE